MNEQELIQRCLNGETSCFEQLVTRYEQQLMRFLKLRCHCHSDADDIFQETFLNAHLYLSGYRNRYAFSTWLFNIALNLTKKYYKSNRVHSSREILEETLKLDQSNEGNIWFFAKKRLSNEQFDLLWFTYAEEYTGREVAFMLDRSLAWVKINLVRAKQQLRQALTDKDLKLADLISS